MYISSFMSTFIYSFFISICGVAFFMESCFQMHIEYKTGDIIFIGASTFVTYLFDGVMAKYKRYNNFIALLKDNIFNLLLMLAATLVCLYYVKDYNTDFNIYLLHLMVLSVAYSIPVFGGRALRTIPLLKTILIIYVWVVVGTVLPSMLYHRQPENYSNIIWEHIFFIAMLAIAFDMRDYEQDLREKIGTLPTLLGEKRASYSALILGPLAVVVAMTINLDYGVSLAVADFSAMLILFRSPSLKTSAGFAYFTDGMILVRLFLVWWAVKY